MAHQQNSDTVKPNYEICGFHVRTVTRNISFFTIFFFAPFLQEALVNDYGFTILFIQILSFIHIFVVLADKFEKPVFYLPFLIIMQILLFIGIIQFIRSISFAFANPKDFIKHISNETTNSTTLGLDIYPDHNLNNGTFMIFLIIFELFEFYYWNVVRKTRAYMTAEIASGNFHRNCAMIGWENFSYA